MALPPERITVKRRRDEEPVDALFIPHKKTRQTLVWNRVSAHEPSTEEDQKTLPSDSQCSGTAQSIHPQIPMIRTTSPEDDIPASQATRPSHSHHIAVDQVNENSFSQAHRGNKLAALPPVAQAGSFPRLTKEPRKFLFTRSTTSPRTSSGRCPSVRYSGIQKSKKKKKQQQHKEFAVFVERTHQNQRSNSPVADASCALEDSDKPPAGLATSPDLLTTPRKRPLASSAEQKWRAQTWKGPLEAKVKAAPDFEGPRTENATTDVLGDASLRLAWELHQFAVEESQASTGIYCGKSKPVVKAKPKPPKPRPAKERVGASIHVDNTHPDVMNVDEGGDESDTFVIDVYLRQAENVADKSSAESANARLETADPDKVGLLVIEDEDQDMWELYGEEDQSSDDGWNSEEEDENAEDYYGNDYPEDELDSDDEYDRNTYTHWRSAFDDEEPDSNIDWSEDESQERRRWRSR
ncbi:MAG: hypothetical protein Q9200_002126 [Gallowayella weberi]